MGSLQLFIRHPEDVPLQLQQLALTAPAEGSNLPIGLVCPSEIAHCRGQQIRISVPEIAPDLDITGEVSWCRDMDQQYEVGITFSNEEQACRMRMLEQLCHIRRYRNHLEQQGQQLSEDEAALQWINKYAHYFPSSGLRID